jgi:hypothetical protein
MGSDKTEIWYVIKDPQRGLGEEFLPKSNQNTIWQHTHDRGTYPGQLRLVSSVLFRTWTRTICPLIWLTRPPLHYYQLCMHALNYSSLRPDARSLTKIRYVHLPRVGNR